MKCPPLAGARKHVSLVELAQFVEHVSIRSVAARSRLDELHADWAPRGGPVSETKTKISKRSVRDGAGAVGWRPRRCAICGACVAALHSIHPRRPHDLHRLEVGRKIASRRRGGLTWDRARASASPARASQCAGWPDGRRGRRAALLGGPHPAAPHARCAGHRAGLHRASVAWVSGRAQADGGFPSSGLFAALTSRGGRMHKA